MTDIISVSCAVRSLGARLWPAAAGSAQINKYSAVRRARQTDICTPTGIFLTWTALHVCFQLLVPSCFCFSEAVALLAPVCYPHHRIYKIKSILGSSSVSGCHSTRRSFFWARDRVFRLACVMHLEEKSAFQPSPWCVVCGLGTCRIQICSNDCGSRLGEMTLN